MQTKVFKESLNTCTIRKIQYIKSIRWQMWVHSWN